jgi:hypothetical protein
MSSITITASGANNFTCPPGITAATIEVWGGGGGGGGSNNTSAGGGGGGGGAYAKIDVTGLIPGNLYAFSVGAGGAGGAGNANGANGANTSFSNNSGGNTSTIILANFGRGGVQGGNSTHLGGAGGAANTATGVTSYAGGAGAAGGANLGGGAGSGAGIGAAGVAGANSVGGVASSGGGNGGNGGALATDGNAGTIPGGGSGGAGAGNGANTGGNGANGQLKITVPNIYITQLKAIDGAFFRLAKVPVFDLTANADNTIAHGLPAAPIEVSYIPTGSGGLWSQAAEPDATNLYIHVASSGSTTGWVLCTY